MYEQPDGTRALVDGYSFYGTSLNSLISDTKHTELMDLSKLNRMDMNVYAISSNYKEVSTDRFYLPSEVNG